MIKSPFPVVKSKPIDIIYLDFEPFAFWGDNAKLKMLKRK
jgi:hypothetical protein